MVTIHTDQTVGELVRLRPALATTFERMGIDYCCSGKAILAEACARKGLDAQSVCRTLEAFESSDQSAADVDPDHLSLHDLVEHIKSGHHAYLRQELPMLGQMLARVVEAHGATHPSLGALAKVFAAFQEELAAHMHKEEFVLFPMIEHLESSGQSQMFHCGNLHNPIGVMEQEHESAGDALQRMRHLTNDYTPPADACATWRALLAGLLALEADMHQHVHKENNILFPKAMELEAALAAGK